MKTPLLWTHIVPPLDREAPVICEYWRLAAERIKAVPANIELFTGSFHPPPDTLPCCCPLDQIKNISSLNIWVDFDMEYLPLWMPVQSDTVSSLNISGNWGRPSLSFEVLSTITFRLNPKMLRLHRLNVSISATPNMLPTVKRLSISSIRGSSSRLHNFFKLFRHWKALKCIVGR